jgi:hypothetical protein
MIIKYKQIGAYKLNPEPSFGYIKVWIPLKNKKLT